MLNFPKTFTDAKGRPWTIDIPLSTYLRLKNSELKINLEDLIFLPKDKSELGKATLPLVELTDDLERFVAVICEILRPEMEKASVTVADFMEALNGSTMMAMTDAFCQALYDFFRCPRKRLILEDMTLKGKAMVETMEKRAPEIAKTTETMVIAVNQEIDNQLKKFAADWPASRELTHSPTP